LDQCIGTGGGDRADARSCTDGAGLADVTLTQEVGEGVRAPYQQREPCHVRRAQLMILWRDQLATDQSIAIPTRIDQIPMPVHPQQLERRIGAPMRTCFPLADGPEADAEEIGRALATEASRSPSVPELVSRNPEQARPTPTAQPVGRLAYFA